MIRSDGRCVSGVQRRLPISDERGAIMVMAVFFAIFGVAILFAAIGTAESVFFQERLQDAADATALSGAVTHARAMNLLVLLNLVMAALLAILVTIKLVQSLAIAGMVLAAGLAYFSGGSTLALIPPLKVLESKMDTAYQTLERPIHETLSALHDTANVVVDVAPHAAHAVALADVDFWGPEIESYLDAAEELPVENDSFATLCGQAGELPFRLASDVLGQVRGFNLVWRPLQSAAGSLASQFSGWFCGDGSGSPPSEQIRVEGEEWPILDSFAACQEERPDSLDVETATTPACLRADEEREQSMPDNDTGSCQVGNDCSLASAYEKRVAKAREDCRPGLGHDIKSYEVQLRTGSVDYEWTGRWWVRGEPRYGDPRREELTFPPCGSSHSTAIGPEYNRVVRESADVNEVLPVCSNEDPPSMDTAWLSRGHRERVDFVEVRHILGCRVDRTETLSIAGAQRAEGGDDKAPKRISSDVNLGDEHFQVRAVARGDLKARSAASLVRLAAWQRSDGDENEEGPDRQSMAHPLEWLQAFDGLAVAQAEYFYDAPDGRDAWMWNMNWRGRLRRFRVPEEEAFVRFGRMCVGINGCVSLLALATAHGGLLAH